MKKHIISFFVGILFSALFIVVVGLVYTSHINTSDTKDISKEEWDTRCQDLGSFGYRVMEMRQSGLAMHHMMNVVKGNELGEIAETIVIQA